MKNKVTLLFVLILLASCTRQYDAKITISGFDETILKNGENINFTSFDIVPLELCSESAISVIKRVEIVDSIIIIQSASKLLAFSLKGEYKFSYGREGRASNEYINLSSFVVNAKNKCIDIVDDFSGKIITFTLKGEFVKTTQYQGDVIQKWTNSGVFINDTQILFSNMIYNDINTIYTIFDTQTKEKVDVCKLPVKTKGTAQSIGRSISISPSGNTNLLIPFENSIYSLNGDKLIRDIAIETNKPIVGKSTMESIDDFGIFAYADLMEKGYFIGFTGIFETSNHIILNQFNLNYFLIDKKSNTGKLYTYNFDESILSIPLLYVVSSHKDKLVGVCTPMDLLLNIKNKIPNNSNDVNIQKLENCLHSITFDSNPVLFFYSIQ